MPRKRGKKQWKRPNDPVSANDNQEKPHSSIFLHLPEHIRIRIVGELDDRSLLAMMTSCRSIYNEIRGSIALWRRKAQQCPYYWSPSDWRNLIRWREQYLIAKSIVSRTNGFNSKLLSPFRRKNAMSWLCLDDTGKIWYSSVGSIVRYEKHATREEELRLQNQRTDISNKFAISGNGFVFAGTLRGQLLLWNLRNGSRNPIFSIPNAHSSDIRSCDLRDSIGVSGGRDGTVAIWRLDSQLASLNLHCRLQFPDGVWTVSVNDGERRIAVGTSSYTSNSTGQYTPLTLCDVERGTVMTEFGDNGLRKGAGITDVRWLNDPNCLVSTNYDGVVRIHDTRVGSHSVWKWEEPLGAMTFSVFTDRSSSSGRGLVVSSSQNSIVWLLDTAYVNGYKGIYMTKGPGAVSSALRTDSTIWASCDAGIHAIQLL